MSQVPGLGHVTFYRHPGRYPTLFHSYGPRPTIFSFPEPWKEAFFVQIFNFFFFSKIQKMSAEEKDVPQNTQDLTVFVQNLLQQMVIAVYYRRVFMPCRVYFVSSLP